MVSSANDVDVPSAKTAKLPHLNIQQVNKFQSFQMPLKNPATTSHSTTILLLFLLLFAFFPGFFYQL